MQTFRRERVLSHFHWLLIDFWINLSKLNELIWNDSRIAWIRQLCGHKWTVLILSDFCVLLMCHEFLINENRNQILFFTLLQISSHIFKLISFHSEKQVTEFISTLDVLHSYYLNKRHFCEHQYSSRLFRFVWLLEAIPALSWGQQG